MTMKIKRIATAGGGLLLAGCVPQVAAGPAAGIPSPTRPSYSMAGLEAVMGQNAAALVRRFGEPDLDVREGAARKLQFGSAVCVLDAYLYPPGGSGESVVTYIDARLPDGRDVDRASCVAAMARR
jgi:hypothetical protein